MRYSLWRRFLCGCSAQGLQGARILRLREVGESLPPKLCWINLPASTPFLFQLTSTLHAMVLRVHTELGGRSTRSASQPPQVTQLATILSPFIQCSGDLRIRRGYWLLHRRHCQRQGPPKSTVSRAGDNFRGAFRILNTRLLRILTSIRNSGNHQQREGSGSSTGGSDQVASMASIMLMHQSHPCSILQGPKMKSQTVAAASVISTGCPEPGVKWLHQQPGFSALGKGASWLLCCNRMS